MRNALHHKSLCLTLTLDFGAQTLHRFREGVKIRINGVKDIDLRKKSVTIESPSHLSETQGAPTSVARQSAGAVYLAATPDSRFGIMGTGIMGTQYEELWGIMGTQYVIRGIMGTQYVIRGIMGTQYVIQGVGDT